jgi:8-oxo-dGTP pyrophosphatase MutT (NUDIX family)
MTDAPAAVRDAATVIVLRDRGGGAEALMLRRHGKSGFAADAWVFPGGTIDAADTALAPERWRGIDPAALAPRFGRPPDVVLGAHVAAVRETFEEAGLLLAVRSDGAAVDLRTDGVRAMRAALVDRSAGGAEFAAWLESEALVLDLGRLTYWARWITPRIEQRRYDTSFFLARAPEGQVAAHDQVETTGQRWLTASAALAAHAAGELNMIHPTIRTLEEMAPLAGVDALIEHATARADVAPILPHFERTDDGWRVLHPGDPGYPYEDYRDELGSGGAA